MKEKKLKKLVVLFQGQNWETLKDKNLPNLIIKILINKYLVKRKDGHVGEFNHVLNKQKYII